MYSHREPMSVFYNRTYLSYLPLAHVFERTFVELGSLYTGFQLYFAESLDTFVQDLQRAQPTLFLSVPRLWVKFQHGVLQKLPKEKLEKLLKEKGYQIARRTVAKYREQMNIPVARLRKEL